MVNVVMICRDRPRHTKQALDSLIENTYTPISLTLMDDGSQDETRKIILETEEGEAGEGGGDQPGIRS